MPLQITAAQFGADAEAALGAALARAKQTGGADDPLAPVTIVAPSFAAGLHLRRLLGRRGRGIVNVQIRPLPALLELLGGPALSAQQRRPLPDAYRTEVIRAVAEAGPQRFADLPIEGSVLRTLEQTFALFDDCEPAQLEHVAEAGGMPRYLVDRYRDYLTRTAGFYTTRDLAESAAAAIDGGAAVLDELGALIVYLPGEWTAPQIDLIRVLAQHAPSQPVQVILGLSGDAETVDQHTLARWQQQPDEFTARLPALPTAQRVVQAPDAEEEVRAAVRKIAAALLADPPTPLHRTAILFRQPAPYARICAEQLDAAQLPWNGPNTQTLGQSIAGRILNGLLNLIESPAPNWPSDVAVWLTAGPIRDDQGELAPVARWNQLARRANLQRDPSRWSERLQHYGRTRSDDLERLQRSGDEARPGRGRWLQAEIDQIDALAAFTRQLVEFIDALPEQAAWSDFANRLRGQLLRLLGGRTAFAQAGAGGDDDQELARWDDVQALLDSFPALDDLGNTTRARFATAVRRGLDRTAGHHGRIGDGVYVGSLRAALGMSWDVVYIVGAAERALPMARREDPLLSDQLRERAAMPVSRDALRRERADFLAALHAAARRVISYPRADVRAQQARLPSRWLLESATALNAGERIYASKIADAPRGVVAATPSFESAIAAADQPGDLQEYDLRSIRRVGLGWGGRAARARQHFLAARFPALQRGFEQHAARNADQFTRWDGLLADGAGSAAAQPHSAGALQDWAVCPHRYFLARVLRVEERAELRDDLQISALDKGSLIHDILDQFFQSTQAPPANLMERLTDRLTSPRERLLAIAEQQLDDAQQRGVTGRKLLWERDRRRILADLETLLERDEQHQAERHVQQIGSEVSFGAQMVDSQGSVTLPLDDGGALPLRGKIDRIDRSADGQLMVVIDYKTGGAYPSQKELNDDPLVRGSALQLPIYAHALRQLHALDAAVTITSGYWFITARGGFAFHEVTWDASADRQFRRVLNLIMRHVRDGVFPQHPGPNDRSRKNNCRFCSFNEVCPADRRPRWNRIKADPRLASYAALSSVPEEDEP